MSDFKFVLGGIYKFNSVRAELCFFEPAETMETVVWKEAKGPDKRKRKPQTLRRTPRWFFEKHARLLP